MLTSGKLCETRGMYIFSISSSVLQIVLSWVRCRKQIKELFKIHAHNISQLWVSEFC
jgi:hypothetical protein